MHVAYSSFARWPPEGAVRGQSLDTSCRADGLLLRWPEEWMDAISSVPPVPFSDELRDLQPFTVIHPAGAFFVLAFDEGTAGQVTKLRLGIAAALAFCG